MTDQPTPTAPESSAITNPLQALQQKAEASMMDYATSPVVETFGHYEAEYAVLRKGVGIFDANQKGVVKVTGADRADFLHRFVTQDVNGLSPNQLKRSFLLTRPGRIAADMYIIALPEEHLLVLDRSDAPNLVKQLDQFLFSEDVQLENISETKHVISLHGPQAALLLNELEKNGVEKKGSGVFSDETADQNTKQVEKKGSGVFSDETADQNTKQRLPTPLLHATAVVLAGVPVTVARTDLTGSLGFDLVMNQSNVLAVYNAILEITDGLTPDVQGGVRRRVTGRGVGWMALNTARIEAGQSIFHIDFGPDSLPHESGALAATVSFTKGCYLGQEIVARMQSLGHPKKLLVGLAFEDDRLPLAGSQVFNEDGATIIGAITSSCLSPLKGNQAIALAMMKWGKHKPGVKVKVTAEGAQVNAEVCEHKL